LAPISPDDWHRLEPLFDQLLDLEPAQRADWLRERADLSDTDRAHLGDLLQAHDSVDDKLDTPLPQSATRLVAASMDDPILGETLGPFKVVEEIGRGGMGVVYLGRRTDGDFTQEVVIKVLRVGVDTEDTRRRFLQERQILANLDHPGIVRLLDGGFTPDGRPYIIMNRVVGQRLDNYCDDHQLEIRARIRLFLGVIEAVDHAHRHLIIHRDLKPSNVWVDKEGKVHLLDFGIAKIAAEDDGPELTMTRQRLMTPEYASPEQVRQDDITTASDVYQLGVLLYKLLTGQYPYDLADRSAMEMEKQICETNPVPASRAVSAGGATAGESKKILRGDLDIILQKTLRKDPARRYLSAHELREDLIRWLNGDRILARPESLIYQAQRFVRRYPVAVILALALVVSSMGFTVFHVQRITTERDHARLESAQRKEVSDFLVNLLRVPDPTAAQGREITARELLEVSIPSIEEGLSDRETKILLYAVVGEVARNLGLHDQAGPALNAVVQHTSALYGPRSLETAAAQAELATLFRLARMFDDAIGPAEDALSIRRELLPAGDVDIGRALKLVAVTHRDLREFELAETEFREAVAILEAGLPADDPLLTVVQIDLAYVLRTVDKGDESEALYRESIPVMRARLDEFHESLPGALNNLAYLLRKKEEYAEAEVLYREAITHNESYFGEAHPSTVTFRNNLAATLRYQGKDEEVIQELKTIIGLEDHLNGATHWRTGSAHRSLGYFLFASGEYDAAVPELRIAANIFTAGLGADHLWTAATVIQLATSLHLAGDHAGAVQSWQQAAPMLQTEAASHDRNVQSTIDRLLTSLPEDDSTWRQKLISLKAKTED